MADNTEREGRSDSSPHRDGKADDVRRRSHDGDVRRRSLDGDKSGADGRLRPVALHRSMTELRARARAVLDRLREASAALQHQEQMVEQRAVQLAYALQRARDTLNAWRIELTVARQGVAPSMSSKEARIACCQRAVEFARHAVMTGESAVAAISLATVSNQNARRGLDRVQPHALAATEFAASAFAAAEIYLEHDHRLSQHDEARSGGDGAIRDEGHLVLAAQSYAAQTHSRLDTVMEAIESAVAVTQGGDALSAELTRRLQDIERLIEEANSSC